MGDDPLVGRETEQALLAKALIAARAGHGSLVLVSGEAGIGKTALVEAVLASDGVSVVRGAASELATLPYGPLTQALRSAIALTPDAPAAWGPLSPQLHLLLPELGRAPAQTEQASLAEALRGALLSPLGETPCVVFIDDLQWADTATIELLASLPDPARTRSVLVVGAYRSDELPRSHPVRRMRAEMRRRGALVDVRLDALDRAGSTALAERVLGYELDGSLAELLHERTQGLPFFVEELAAALVASDRLRPAPGGVELAPGTPLPIPETVRDAVLLRAESLSAEGRAAVEAAAIAGLRFDLASVAELSTEAGLDEAIERAVLVETSHGQAAFRHALTREAFYADIPWTRRRALHRAFAELGDARGAPGAVLAEHWIGAAMPERARTALARAAEESARLHAYRDAVSAARRALELWTDGTAEAARVAVLERLAGSCEIVGDAAEASRAWREAVEAHVRAGDLARAGHAYRRLANAHELQGSIARAITTREQAVAAFDAAGLPGESAIDRMLLVTRRIWLGDLAGALRAAEDASRDAERSGDAGLRVRALARQGAACAKTGDVERGRDLVQHALSIALAEKLPEAASEAYQELGVVLSHGAAYGAARDAYIEAYDYCQTDTDSEVCLACLASVLNRTGEWTRAATLSREIIESTASGIARGSSYLALGFVHAARGEPRRARPLLAEVGTMIEGAGFAVVEIELAWALALAELADGDYSAASAECRRMLARSNESGDRHYAIPALRLAVTVLAQHGTDGEARACAEALAVVAAATGNREALAGLAHALGEVALLDGDPASAAGHFGRALEELRTLELPFERAQTQLRTGVALAATGRREDAMIVLTESYRCARKLGARPLAAQVVAECERLGEPVGRRLGRRAARERDAAGLTPRELQIIRAVATGQADREIAKELFLSPRTVEMHVQNALAKLDCRSRAEAAARAAALGLLKTP